MPSPIDPLFKERTDELMWRVCRVAELFRVKDTEVPGQLVSVFCYVASHNPCHMQSIQEGLGLSPNSTSRNTDWLSTHHRLGKPGMGLITKADDPRDMRRKMVKLTPKGEEMVKSIKEILYAVKDSDLVG